MTVRSSEFGGSPFDLGDLRLLPLSARHKYFTENGQEWLYSGTLRSNAGNAYAGLLAKSPGNGVNFLSAADRVGTVNPAPSSGGPPFFTRHEIYWDGNRYVAVPPGLDLTGNPTIRTGATLGTISTSVQPNAVGDSMCGHCQFSTNGRIIFALKDTTAGQGLRYLNAAGAMNNSSGAASKSFASVTSSGTLAVAIARAETSNSPNAIATSTEGVTWTQRTGSSSLLNGSMLGVHWAPHLTKFLTWGVAALGGYGVLSSTDGFTFATAMALDTAYHPQDAAGTHFSGWNASAASTPNATLLPARRVSDNIWGWMRTTNGTTWTFVGPFLDPLMRLQDAVGAGSVLNLVYDAARTRLVAWVGNNYSNSGDFPSYYYSTDDGVTWTAGPCMDDEDTTISRINGMSVANGNDLLLVGIDGSASLKYLYPGAKLANIASHVGLIGSYQQVTGINYALRIK